MGFGGTLTCGGGESFLAAERFLESQMRIGQGARIRAVRQP